MVITLRHNFLNEDDIVRKGVPDEVTLISAKGTHSVALLAPDFTIIRGILLPFSRNIDWQ